MTTLSPIPRAVVAGRPRGKIVRATWQQQTPPPHEFVAFACPEDDGGFSIFAANYPGVVSQGETLDEAKDAIAEAFLAMLQSKRKHGEKMEFSLSPWMDVEPNCKRVRIKVDG